MKLNTIEKFLGIIPYKKAYLIEHKARPAYLKHLREVQTAIMAAVVSTTIAGSAATS